VQWHFSGVTVQGLDISWNLQLCATVSFYGVPEKVMLGRRHFDLTGMLTGMRGSSAGFVAYDGMLKDGE
jgi:hypothetical protein